METIVMMNEGEILGAAKTGNENAFTLLVQQHQHRIYGYLVRLLPQPDDAEELTQEVLLEMVRGLPSFRGDSSLTTWLFRIATNKVAEFYRRQSRRPAIQFGELDEENTQSWPSIPDQNFSPLDHLEQKERQQLYERAFKVLPEIYRSVLLLRIQENLLDREIAEVLDCPLGTVKWRLHHAMVLMGRQISVLMEGGG